MRFGAGVVRRFCGEPLAEGEATQTFSARLHSKRFQLGPQELHFTIWDVPGAMRNAQFIKIYCRSAQIAMVFADLSTARSLDGAKEIVALVRASPNPPLIVLIGEQRVLRFARGDVLNVRAGQGARAIYRLEPSTNRRPVSRRSRICCSASRAPRSAAVCSLRASRADALH